MKTYGEIAYNAEYVERLEFLVRALRSHAATVPAHLGRDNLNEAADLIQTKETNGQFVMRCVEAHNELVAALRDLVNMHAMDGLNAGVLYTDRTGAMERARAALAKVQA
jgi:hypothetical protein